MLLLRSRKEKTTQPKIVALSSLTHPRDLFPWIISLASAPHLPQHSKFSVAPTPHLLADLIL